MLVLIWCVALLAAIVLFFRQRYSRFKAAGVRHLSPVLPCGNNTRVMLRTEHMITAISKSYDSFPGDRFIGHFSFADPTVVVKDRDLIKQITLKDFDHFVDHQIVIDANIDPLFGRNLFSLKGSEWRDMRSALSPAFTTSKIRLMIPFMTEIGNQMNQVLKDKINSSKDGHILIDCRDVTTRYANDVIASCAFGVKFNSHADENNEFYVKGLQTTTFGFKEMMKLFGFIICPKIMSLLNITLFPKEVQKYFRNLVLSVMKNREEQNIIRPDMIHLLMQAKKGNLTHDEKAPVEDAGFATVEESHFGKKKITREWSDDDLVSQAILFFVAGFDTVSTVVTFLLQELALNPEVQDRLAKEIRDNDAKNGGKVDFKSIQEMTYMDMVVSETLRLWPPAMFLERICDKDFNLGNANSKSTKDYIIRKGEGICIPIWAIHRDPQYFQDPLKFDPERFSDENKSSILPYTYMPFGIGPRNCIGSRFALCEIKVMVYQFLKELEVAPCEKTCIPITLATNTLSVRIKGGAWLRATVRSTGESSSFN